MWVLLRALQSCALWLWEQAKKAKSSWLNSRASLMDDLRHLQCVCVCVCVFMYTNLCVCVPVAICVGVHMLTGISTRIPGLTT